MDNMKKLIYFILGAVLFSGTVVFAAPYFQPLRSIVPLDSTENIGTSTAPWDEGHFNRICLTADCRTAWPAGTGGGAFAWTTQSWGVSTSTTLGFFNGFISTASSTITSALRLSSLSSGSVGIGAGGLLYSAATTTYSTGLTYAGGAVTCNTASASVFGCLASADWTTFNNKQGAISVTWPITLSGATIGFNGLSTSTAAVIGNIPYFSGANTFANIATGTVSSSGGITTTASRYVLNGALSISCDVASGSIPGCLSAADWTTFNNKVSTSRALTVAGTASQITSSAGAQDLSADRTWTLSLPNHVIFPSSFQVTRATTTHATTTNLDITNLLTFNGVTGSTWAAFCTTITGGAGLCDGVDDTGGGGGAGNSKWATSTADTLAIHTTNALRVGIGTTTPRWSLQLASSTGPQLALTDSGAGTNLKHWTMRSAGGNLYFATSSDAFATSTTAAIGIASTGVVTLNMGLIAKGALDFGDAVSMEIPNGTAPTVDSTGELALDTTSNNLVLATSTGDFVVASASTTLYSFLLASTSPDFASGGVIELPRHPLPQTVMSIGCMVDGGTNKVIVLSDNGTNDMTSVTCTTTWNWYTISSNNNLTANEAVRVEVGASSGSPDYVNVRVMGYRRTD